MAAYGTSEAAALRSLETVDSLVRDRFPDNEVTWALTSRWFLAKFRKEGRTSLFSRNVPVRSLEEVYTEFSNQGKTRAAVQCLLVHEGSESDIVLKTPAPGLDVKYGLSLFSTPGNIEKTIHALSPHFGTGETATILVGHGVDDKIELNRPFLEIDELVRKRYQNVFLGTIHGPPGTEPAFDGFRTAGAKEAVFIPLMITASEHILHDVMGEQPESWRNQLAVPARVGPSFAQTPAVLDLFLDSLHKTLSEFGD